MANDKFKETEELFDFLVSAFEAFQNITEDGKFKFITDVPHLLKPSMKAGKAFSGIKQVPIELLQKSEEDKAELQRIIQEKFDIADDVAEVLIEGLILHGIGFYSCMASLLKKKKVEDK